MTAVTTSLPWAVPTDHPAFAGHFPGQPILPGVCILSEVIERVADRLGPSWVDLALQVGTAKFLAPLRPGDDCVIDLHHDGEPSAARRLRFEVRCAGVTAATGTLERLDPEAGA